MKKIPWGWAAAVAAKSAVAKQPTWRRPMSCSTDHPDRDETAAQANRARILVSLELSRQTWLVTALAPASEKMAKHNITVSAAETPLGSA